MSIYCPDCGRVIDAEPAPGKPCLCPCCGLTFHSGVPESATQPTVAPPPLPAAAPVAARPAAVPVSGADGRTTAPYSPAPSVGAATPFYLPPPSRPDKQPTATAVPHVPGYEVLGVLGRGGMGVVYKARQVGLNRVVALKMILAGPHAGPEHLARFKAEAEAVARLQHAHIVQIHEIGDAGGRPFFSLEFVDGPSLAARLGGTPQPPADAARLLETLARALEAAHAHGIVHRDLKPANVLLSYPSPQPPPRSGEGEQTAPPFPLREGGPGGLGEAVPKVADFGLAKQMNADSGQTHTGQVLGTPSYMAPEQATGRLDLIGPATDVYALGAILYECLTGRPPFKGASVMDTLDQVRNQEPVSPRQLQPKTPRDLETICLKCLQKHPGRRYPSAAALGDDLARFLKGEPVQARPVGRIERGWRWCRRNPARAGVAVLALLVVAAVVALLVGVRAGRARRELALREAEQMLDLAEPMVARGQYQAAHDPLLRAQAVLDSYPDSGERRDRLQALLDRVEPRLRIAAFTAAARAAEYHLLGSLWVGVSEEGRPVGPPLVSRYGAHLDDGVRQARDALKLLGLPAAPGPAADETAARARASELLLLLALAQERKAVTAGDGRAALLGEAVGHLRKAEALDGRPAALYEARARLLRALGRKDEADADEKKAARPPATFLDHHLRAGVFYRRGQWPEAAAAFDSALAFRRDEYWTLFRLAKVRENLGRYADAENLFHACIALRPDDPTAYNNQGTVLLSQRRWPDAARAFEAALARDPDYVLAYGNLMLAHAENKDVAGAEKVYGRYLARRPGDRGEQARALNSLGLAYERAGRPEQALAQYDAALAHDGRAALVHRNRAVVLLALRRAADAEPAIRQAVALAPDSGDYRYVLGNVLAALGQEREARQAYTAAVTRSPGMWSAWYNRALLCRRVGQRERALADLDRALALAPGNAAVLRERARTLAGLKRFEAALEDARRLDAAHGGKGEVRRLRGAILGDMGRLEQSERELTRAIVEAPAEPDGYRSRAVTRMKAHHWQGAIDDFKDYLRLRPEADDLGGVYNDLSVAYLELGERGKARGALDEARAALDKAVALRPTPGVLTNRGFFFLRVGALGPAVADFDTVLGRDKTFDRAWALRGQARLRLGQYAGARSDFARALELLPGHYETLLYHALACHLGADDRAARADLAQVVRDRPDHVRGKFARGMLHFLDGEWSQAVGLLSRAEDDEVLRPWVLHLRARAWLRLGPRCLPAATADADARLRLFPGDGLAHLLAGRVYARAASEAGADVRDRLRGQGLDLLERAVKRQPELARGLADDPELEAVRGEARFKRLLP